ncbi:Uma2 family endonuclease [Kitasatospora sp. NPDC089913]|uniref:Uma2 family endonuclease n=1 Tax=Kitasatospora sp. NPDC089913 TaxID=3364080 RepID=UPI00380FEE3C
MTTDTHRAMTFFEGLEAPEGWRAELVRGEIVLSMSSDLTANLIVESVRDRIPHRRWHSVTTQDVSIPGRVSELQPDLVVWARGAAEVRGRAIPAPAVTLVVEVVSRTSVLRDYRTKRELYAEGTVPAYLIVDPVKGVCVLLTEPTVAAASGPPDYVAERTTRFGEPIPLDLLGITLDTTEFQPCS